ncbi:MAG: hypothetical protein JWQ48_1286 [Conexibacter sp.]|nr:hypothetical protein [Conexibacter sp.]
MDRTGDSTITTRRSACIGGLLDLAYAAAVRSESGVAYRRCSLASSPAAELGRGRGPSLRRGAPMRRRPPGGSPLGRRHS